MDMNGETKDLSIIIVSWNSEASLRRCLKSVYAQTSDISFEVIVVDNASKDKTVQMVMNEFGAAAVIQNDRNRGFAAAVNQGLAVASGTYICLLNPDTEIRDRALEQLVSAMEQNPRIGVAGPHMLNEDGTTQPSVRRFPKLSDQLLIVSKLHLLRPDAKSLSRYLARDVDYSRSQEVEQVMGACFMMRRSVIEQIGALDETFFIWFEEVDYCRRVKERTELRVWYIADAHVVHIGGESFAKINNSTKQRWYNKSLRHYFWKHKHYGAYLVLILFWPISLGLGLISAILSRSKTGQGKIKANRETYKRL